MLHWSPRNCHKWLLGALLVWQLRHFCTSSNGQRNSQLVGHLLSDLSVFFVVRHADCFTNSVELFMLCCGTRCGTVSKWMCDLFVVGNLLVRDSHKFWLGLGMLIPGYLDTRVPCGLPESRPGSRKTSNLPSYRDHLHQNTDCPCGHIQTELLFILVLYVYMYKVCYIFQ